VTISSLEKNIHLQSFYKDISSRFNKDSEDMTNGQWMCKNTSLNKKDFCFTRYPFQEQIANDMHENLSCIKPSQVGLTEIQIRKALTIMRRYENKSLIYTMPNEKMFKRISKGRIIPIIEFDKAFRDVTKYSMDLIPIGSNFMYVTGSTEGDATSINADFIFHDEVDLTPPDMLALFGSRLQGSDIRIKQSFSTPKWDGFGIHKDYAASDQNEYMIKCRACNHWQIPLFTKQNVHIPGGCLDLVEDLNELEENMVDEGLIDLENTAVKCRKCHRHLNLADTANREWVATYQNRTHARGYQVRPFSTHTLSPKYIITELFKYKRRDNLAGWQNTVLGETATAGNKRLSKPQIENVMKGETITFPPVGTPVHIGIDVGQTCNIVMGTGPTVEEQDIFYYGTCGSEALMSTVKHFLDKCNIVSGGIDRYPYTPTANAVRDLSKGVIMPIEYSSGKEIVEDKDSLGLVVAAKVNRTMMLDYVANGIRNCSWSLRGYGQEKAIVITHMMDMVRESPEEGQSKWIKLNGTDHYFHAKAFLVSGMLQRGVCEAKAGHQKVEDQPFEVGLFGEDFSNMNDCQDLIGFGGYRNPKDKIITTW
jgi:hypothetical protein